MSNRPYDETIMGRLFWKFFLFFWLAQVLTTFGVGISIWLLRPEHGAEPIGPERPSSSYERIDQSSPPPFSLSDAKEPDRRPPHERRSIIPPLLPLIAGSIVSLLFAALLASYFARPIRNLQHAFESVSDGKLDTRIGNSMRQRHDELSDLGNRFDVMAQRLQSLVERQQHLLHDVSHELRSPLARLQAAADLMRQQPERVQEFIERIERDTGRMDRLVGELLTLARLGAGIHGNLDMNVDLEEVINSIVEDAKIEAELRRCQIVTSFMEKPILKGNSDLIRRAVENIVRNALRHTPDGGTITIAVSVSAEKPWVHVDVMDEGKGMPEQDLGKMFEPFYRGVGTDAFSGYGLGLAITQGIVLAHGGKVSANNRAECGLLVRLSLPLGNG